ncbi:NDR1/HIN1-like protein 10 [Trifolium pratense]|uniref:NDR1/HIN1-like protein 10 n=1 Tax=Trifolium pratense TaxID=57577 RepID=UPI001E6913E2|nr:NDR1/HIN1-like protein 10 [Trifolium pratense]
MADNKQPQLNGAYYGPAIPPPTTQPRYSPNSYCHHRDRSCCSHLFGIFWKLLIALIVLFGLVILIFYLIVQPRVFKFYVTEAKLTQFDYINNTLHYNMVLNFTVHNSNKKHGIYYDKVETRAFYQGSRFANVDVITHMNSFCQYKRSSDPMSGVFSGQRLMCSTRHTEKAKSGLVASKYIRLPTICLYLFSSLAFPLNNDQIFEFNKDKSLGVYDIDKSHGIYDIHVKLYFKIRFRHGDTISRKYKLKVKCDLNVPLSSSNNETFTFSNWVLPNKCKVVF